LGATDKLASRKWRNEHRNQRPDAGGNPWDTNLIDQLQIQIGGNNYNDWPTNGGNWQLARTADLTEWQDYYRKLAAKTNEFPIAPQLQSPAQDVLLALSKYDPTIEELRQTSQLSYSRFPLDYDDEDPAEILLPHLAALKRCSQILRLRALAELQNGQSEKAFADVQLALRLADAVRTEPFIITHLVRIAILDLTLQPIWEGLAEHKWSDAQLAELDSELAKLDFLADYKLSVSGERAAHVIVEPAGPAGPGFFFEVGVGRDQDLRAVGDDAFHLSFVPVAGVSDDSPWAVVHARLLEVAQRGVKDRLEVPEVW